MINPKCEACANFSDCYGRKSSNLRIIVYDLEEDPYKTFLDLSVNEAEELITRPELFAVAVDFFSGIRKEGYSIAILKEGDSL